MCLDSIGHSTDTVRYRIISIADSPDAVPQ